MALTAVVIDPSTVAPKDLTYLALTNGANKGFALSLGGISPLPKVVRIVGDAAWYWSYQDSQAVAFSSMAYVPPYQAERVQVGGSTLNLYCNVVSGTTNLQVILEY